MIRATELVGKKPAGADGDDNESSADPWTRVWRHAFHPVEHLLTRHRYPAKLLPRWMLRKLLLRNPLALLLSRPVGASGKCPVVHRILRAARECPVTSKCHNETAEIYQEGDAVNV